MQYHYHLQGFIYNLLKDSKYHYIHNKEGYKFFCFSNIFPVTRNLEKGDLRTLIISSPDSEFISYLYEMLYTQCNTSEVKVGCMRFRIDSVNKVVFKLPDNSPSTLITGTPIVIRIPKEKYESYGIKPSKNYDYVYWRSEYPVDSFVSQLENNLVKKYAEYSRLMNVCEYRVENVASSQRSSFFLIEKLKFKKQISTRIFMKGFEQVVIGTVWEFGFNMNANNHLIQFALDSGLGERNSLGFGFMNYIEGISK